MWPRPGSMCVCSLIWKERARSRRQVLQALKQSSVARKCCPSGAGAAGMTPSERVIPFVKANACGNDFLIIDGVYVPADVAEFSRRICDRHHGVGADGVEWLFPAPDADVRAQLFNADGSEAEISGNGTRCVAAYLCSERRWRQVHDPHRRRNQELRTDQSQRIPVRVRNRHGRAAGWRRNPDSAFIR